MKSCYAFVALALMTSTAARADVSVFDNMADFRAAAPVLITETFDDLPDMQVPLTIEIDNIEFNTRGIWQVPGGCALDRSLGASSIARRNISFLAPDGGAGGVRAFGFLLTTFAVAPPADYSVAVVTLDGVVTVETIDDVTSAIPAYRGFVSTSPIVRVTITAVGLTQFNFCFDDVSHSRIIGDVE
jgi:hypothetical protein